MDLWLPKNDIFNVGLQVCLFSLLFKAIVLFTELFFSILYLKSFLVILKFVCNFYFQFSTMKAYLESGGSMLVLLGEGGESRFETNINFFLEEYGIMVNNGE